MNRRHWFARLFSAFALPLVWPVNRLLAEETKQQASLEDRLKSGLLCRRPEEFDFVALVVSKVEAGELPQDLVLNTMRYAVKKRARFPFFYFQYALFRQADALGVDIGQNP